MPVIDPAACRKFRRERDEPAMCVWSARNKCPLARTFERVRLLSRVADPPDAIAAVVGDQQRAVRRDRDADRAAPDVPVVDDEAGHEVLVFAAGVAGLVQRDANQLVADADRAVPRAVFGGEDVALDIPPGNCLPS